MDYTERLNHITSLQNDNALETILSEAANASQDETIVKLYTGALIQQAYTRKYGDSVMDQIASAMSLRKSAAYERRGIVEFYGEFSACAEICNEMPAIRYSHFKDAMRLGKHYHASDQGRAVSTAFKALRYASDNDMRAYQFRDFVTSKTKPESSNRVGSYIGLIVGVDERGAMMQITQGDMKRLHEVQEDVLRLIISVDVDSELSE